MATTIITDCASPLVATPTDDAVTADMLLQKLEEMLNISKWLNRNGRTVIKKLHKSQSSSAASRRRRASSSTADVRKSTGDSLKRPVVVCPRLATFLSLQPGEEVTRPDVTRAITAYVKENELQVPSNRKTFSFDQKLATLFDREVGYVTDFFKLQKEINTIVKTKQPEEVWVEPTTTKGVIDEAPPAQSAIVDVKKVPKRKVKKIPEEMMSAIGMSK